MKMKGMLRGWLAWMLCAAMVLLCGCSRGQPLTEENLQAWEELMEAAKAAEETSTQAPTAEATEQTCETTEPAPPPVKQLTQINQYDGFGELLQENQFRYDESGRLSGIRSIFYYSEGDYEMQWAMTYDEAGRMTEKVMGELENDYIQGKEEYEYNEEDAAVPL